MKPKKRFVCKECGYSSATWIGKCPECASWNSFAEEVSDKNAEKKRSPKGGAGLVSVGDIEIKKENIVKTDIQAINDFFGEGIVAGSVTLIAGEPGIGKSTFLLMLSQHLPAETVILYFSGEESALQIKKRYERTKKREIKLFISNENKAEAIAEECRKKKPDIVLIDSIQTCFSESTDSSPGTVSQIRDSASILTDTAKELSIPMIITGHVTKTGDIAGPKIMEHIVDAVAYFEGDEQRDLRILRTVKNRFGSIDEVLIMEMKESGLELIDNPSGFFINKEDQDSKGHIGRVKAVIMEGRRPLLVDVEALVVPSVYSSPRRFAEGVDFARISRIAAIIDKHLGENLNNYDIYFNISGGIKTKDVGIDLAAAFAIYSSKSKTEINSGAVFIGELSLTGNVRNVRRIEQRVREARNLGMKHIMIPRSGAAVEGPGIEMCTDIKSAINNIK